MRVLVPGYGRSYVDGDGLDDTAPLVFTIDGVLSRSECAALIDRIETLGPTAAPITTAGGPVMRSEVRNNTRVMFDDAAFAQVLFERIAPHVPRPLCGMQPVGANERFRCYRYEVDQRFAPHYDGAFVRDEHERSLLTFMVYLNDGFRGGATDFHDFDVRVVPKTGTALLFQHLLLHEGCFVTSGVKYALRTDVMYRRQNTG
jgi:predicted 2-oxoglutarate/Fe(II)-dependent dioxygenase YbiX